MKPSGEADLPEIVTPLGDTITPDHPDYWMHRFVWGLTPPTQENTMSDTKLTPAERQARMDAEDDLFVEQEAPEFAPQKSELFDTGPFADPAPGAPFFDEVLNYLQSNYTRASAEHGKLLTKKYKLEDEIATRDREMETIRDLILHEWRERQPIDPNTDDVVPEPFLPIVFGDAIASVGWPQPDLEGEEEEEEDDDGPDIDA